MVSYSETWSLVTGGEKATHLRNLVEASGQSNLTKGLIAATDGRFNRIRQVAPICTPSNTCFSGSIRVHTPKRHLDRFTVYSRFHRVDHRDRQTVR